MRSVATFNELELVLARLIDKTQTGEDKVAITGETVPLKDIKHFDSLTALEVLTELEEEIGFCAQSGAFLNEINKKKLCVKDVALAIWQQMQAEAA